MSAAELQRLFGRGEGVGSGPRTWDGGDEGQQRKVKVCPTDGKTYSVSSEDCPYCRERRCAEVGRHIAKRIRLEMARLKSVPGHCKMCYGKMDYTRKEFCSRDCSVAHREEKRRLRNEGTR